MVLMLIHCTCLACVLLGIDLLCIIMTRQSLHLCPLPTVAINAMPSPTKSLLSGGGNTLGSPPGNPLF